MTESYNRDTYPTNGTVISKQGSLHYICALQTWIFYTKEIKEIKGGRFWSRLCFQKQLFPLHPRYGLLS
jgi:hypothetical protein